MVRLGVGSEKARSGSFSRLRTLRWDGGGKDGKFIVLLT